MSSSSSSPSSSSAAPAASSAGSAAPSPPAVSSLLVSQLDELASNASSATRTARTEVRQSTFAAQRFWNETIAKPTNRAVGAAAKEWGALRKQYPWQIVGAITTVTLIASLPFRRLARIRNPLLALAASSLAVAPVETVGTLSLLRDRAAISIGMHAPSTVIVQAPVATLPAATAPQQQQQQQPQKPVVKAPAL